MLMYLFIVVFFYPALLFTGVLVVGSYLPSFIEHFFASVIKFLIFTEIDIRGLKIKIFHFILFVCSLTFMQFNLAYYRLAEERDNADWRVRKKMLMTKFRIERNYWISLFTLTLWIVLNRYRHAVKEISDLRKKLKNK